MNNIERPYVICHMMSTIDGKIASGIKGVNLLDDDYFSTYTKTEDLLEAHAWMIGRVTMEMFASGVNTPLPSGEWEINGDDYLANSNIEKVLIVLDTQGVLRWKKNTIDFSNIDKPLDLVVIVTRQTPNDYLAYLQDLNISYLFGGDEEVDFKQALKSIKDKLKVEKLLLEGGALLNGSVMAQNLIDEISLLLCPLVVNRSSAPSVFERSVEAALSVHKFTLTDVQKMDKDSVWLRYKKAENN